MALALGTELEQSCNELLLAWQRAAYSRTLAAELVFSMILHTASLSQLNAASRVIRQELATQRRISKSLLRQYDKAVSEAKAKGGAKLTDEFRQSLFQEQWARLGEEPQLREGLAATESMAFNQLYFAVEHFIGRLVEVVSVKEGLCSAGQAFPLHTSTLKQKSKRLFPEQAGAFWASEIVSAAEVVRNAIAHRGGATRQAEDLVLTRAGFFVLDGRLSIRPRDTHRFAEELAKLTPPLLGAALQRLGYATCPRSP